MTTLVKNNGNAFPGITNDFFAFDDFFGRDLFNFKNAFSKLDRAAQLPSVNITEHDKEFCIELAAPGLDKKDFKIEVSDEGLLTISAEKEEEKTQEKKHYTRKEFSYKSFCRSFQLPENSLADKLNAKYDNGVLKLTLPKKNGTPNKVTKQIPIS